MLKKKQYEGDVSGEEQASREGDATPVRDKEKAKNM